MATEKELKVLNKIFEIGGKYKPVHYTSLVDAIFSADIQKRYRLNKIYKMSCGYLGKMARKDYIQAAYGCTDGGYTYFIGYYLRTNGWRLLNLK